MSGPVSREVADEARQCIRRYREALKYLDTCGNLTLDKYKEAWRLTGANMTEWQIKGMWDAGAMAYIATRDPDYLRTNMREKLQEAIAVFEKVVQAGP